MKTKTLKHTPLPWVAKGDGRIAAPTQDGLTVPIVAKVQGLAEEVAADTAFIVKAVNSHEAMLEALGVAYQFFNTEANTPDKNGFTVAPDSAVRVVLRKMRQALTQAEGK